ncbi:hypothetical protein [Bacteroides oleiciplenus]|uniref:Uncharacterized protein n=1 Tax=Bacteroides oleiciplenus TaxID=626931 RepID=A0A3E5B396_9BACE|nr:hypothetical protein [Bacteroides oleiciplenus]RGN32012.1 hypothetical protein DXB65_19425 [Bacteroides oleiciplenus]
MCICIFSCSSDENTYTQSDKTLNVYSELNEKLATYNAAFWSENNIPQTRSFWKRLKGYLLADAGGALIGSVFGGWGSLFGAIFCSAVAGPAYAEHEMKSKDDGIITIDTTIFKPITRIPTTRNPEDMEPANPENQGYGTINSNVTVTNSGIGYLHNTILSKINQKHPDVYKQSVSSETMAKYIVTEMKEYNLTISETEQSILIHKVNSTIPKDDVDPNIELIILLKNAYPGFSDELSVLDDFATNVGSLTNSTELVKKYLEGYLQVIENSNLTDSQKEILKSGLEVAANSAVLWVVE